MDAKQLKKIETRIAKLSARVKKMPSEKDLKSSGAKLDTAITHLAGAAKAMKGEED